MRRDGLVVITALLAAVLVGAACSSPDSHEPTGVAPSTTAPLNPGTTAPPTTVPASERVVLAVHDGELDAVAMNAPFTSQTVLAARSSNARGISAIGPICLDPVDDRLVGVGVGGATPGVAILELRGHGLGDLAAQVRVERAATIGSTVTGCAFLDDGRLVVIEQKPTGAGRVTMWPAALGDVGPPCVLDSKVVGASGVTALRAGFVVAAAARTLPVPGLYAYEPSSDACTMLSLRLAAQLGAVDTLGPAAITTAENRVWAVTGAGRIVATNEDGSASPSIAPPVAAFKGTTVRGLATVAKGTLYATTQGPKARTGVLWLLTVTPKATLARPMASSWSATGGVAVYTAPG